MNEVFRTTPFVQNDPNWRCPTWVEQVLARIISDGGIVGTSQLDWRAIEQTGREYVAKKKSAGRYTNATDLMGPRSAWNMLKNLETVPWTSDFLLHMIFLSKLSDLTPPPLSCSLHLYLLRERIQKLVELVSPACSQDIATPSRCIFPVMRIPS